jgi:tetratricopeptide (TPR) repeat protein
MNKKILVLALGFCIMLSSCALKKTPSREVKLEGKDFNFYLNEGLSSLNRSDYENALEQFNMAIALNPNSARAHNLQGVAFFRLNNFKDAEEQFQKAVALNASYAEAYNNLGSLYFAKRQFEKAKDMFKKTLSLSPDSVSALYSLGTLLMFLGQVEEGISYLSRGIELDPDFLETHKTLVVDIPSAGSTMSEIYFTFAKVYAAKGDVDKTVEFLKKAQKAGFRNWQRIMEEKDFEVVREDPKVKEFIH